MRGKPTIATVQYSPGPVPADVAQLRAYLQDEFNRIAAALQLVADGYFAPTYAPPAKPRMGMLRYADGVQWNPGSGAGLYFYNDDDVWSWISS